LPAAARLYLLAGPKGRLSPHG